MVNSDFDDEFATASSWAQQYRSLDLQIVPAWMPAEVPRGQSWKRPRIKDWRQYQHVLVGDDVFKLWYAIGGEYASRLNMGVICGECSHNLFIIDLDIHKKHEAASWWNGLLAVHNNRMELETAEQRTGGGGRQILFYAPDGWRCPTNRTSIGVDIRGQGGFAVLAPSIHDSGTSYSWLEGRAPWDEAGIMMAPGWLLQAIERLVADHGGNGHAGTRTHTPSPEGDLDGFGRYWDGREDRMTRLIWGAVVDWRRQCPIKPGDAEQRRYAAEKYLVYERTVTPRLVDAGRTKTDLLEEEGRGPSAFWIKFQYAVAQWDEDVASEAKKPGTKSEYSGHDKAKGTNGPQPGGAQSDPSDDDDEFAKAKTPPPKAPLILTDLEFLKGFRPPDYLVDGMLQRSYLYSLTARTGHGKTAIAMLLGVQVARGISFHGKQTEQGGVLFLAGENPDDIRARYLALASHLDFKPGTIPFHFIDGVINIQASMDKIRAEAAKVPNLSLVIVDTQAAFFLGDEGNSNEQQKWFAQLLRALIKLPGHPAVLVNCHPVKNATQDNLVPMGGSAFLNEVDGNLTLWSDDKVCVLGPHPDKWRGVTFEELSFELRQILCEALKDTKDRPMPSVIAVPIDEEGATRRSAVAEENENVCLRLLHADKHSSFASVAKRSGFTKSKVQKIFARLLESKFVYKYDKRQYRITKKGCTRVKLKYEAEKDEE